MKIVRFFRALKMLFTDGFDVVLEVPEEVDIDVSQRKQEVMLDGTVG